MDDALLSGLLGRTLAVLLVIAACLWRDVSLLPDGRLHLDVLDVGQGDSLLLTAPSGLRVLIDGGPDARALAELGRLLPVSNQRIDMVVLTHPHRDHLVSLPAVLRRGGVRTVLLSGPTYDSAEYRSFLREAAEAGAAVLVSDPATALDLGHGLSLDILWPLPETYGRPWQGNVNDASVALAVRWHGACLALLTGDLEEKGEEAVLQSGAEISCQLLKVGHHGGRTSTSAGWLLAVRPTTAAISAGMGNSYGHPSPEVLARLEQAGIQTRRTDLEGTLSFTWDGVP